MDGRSDHFLHLSFHDAVLLPVFIVLDFVHYQYRYFPGVKLRLSILYLFVPKVNHQELGIPFYLLFEEVVQEQGVVLEGKELYLAQHQEHDSLHVLALGLPIHLHHRAHSVDLCLCQF